MRTVSLLSIVALAVAASPTGPAFAQVCPPGYYYAADGRCYPTPPPAYPPPVYDVAPPVYQPPPVFDGFALGIGLGALVGGLAGGHERHERGGERGHHEERGRR